MNHIEKSLRLLLIQKISSCLNKGIDFNFEVIKEFIEQDIGTKLKDTGLSFLHDYYNRLANLDYLLHLLEEEHLKELILHSPDHIQLEAQGNCLKNHQISLEKEDYELSLQIFVHHHKQEWNYSNPFTSFHAILKNENYRATLIHHSLTPQGNSKLFLRKIRQDHFDLSHFSLPSHISYQILEAIKQKKNILISGATASGKTSFLKSLLKNINQDEHLVILEDTHEISLNQGHTTNLVSSTLHKNKSGVKSLKEFCSYALRMRPDRIVLGELRSDEVVPFTLAMNTGHKGLMTSIHADDANNALSRMALLFSLFSHTGQIQFEAIYKLICQNINMIIHLDKREVAEIIEVKGSDKGRAFFEYLYKAEKRAS